MSPPSLLLEIGMRKELKLILRETPIGVPPTPKQAAQREKFAQVAKEVAGEMKDTKLRGAARVRAFNASVSQKLKERTTTPPLE
ncbi:hypothetical protein ES706_04789 [subsurface metagenome]